MVNLQRLLLDDNEFEFIPIQLYRVTSLRELTISSNLIHSMRAHELAQLENLHSLDLSHNFLTDLPLEMFNLQSLEHLCLSHNRISRVPIELGNLTALVELRLDHNLIERIPDELCLCTFLHLLDLSHNHIDQVPVEIIIDFGHGAKLDRARIPQRPSTRCRM